MKKKTKADVKKTAKKAVKKAVKTAKKVGKAVKEPKVQRNIALGVLGLGVAAGIAKMFYSKKKSKKK